MQNSSHKNSKIYLCKICDTQIFKQRSNARLLCSPECQKIYKKLESILLNQGIHYGSGIVKNDYPNLLLLFYNMAIAQQKHRISVCKRVIKLCQQELIAKVKV